jgi:MFS family permease
MDAYESDSYGTLAPQFFAGVNPSAAFIFTLLVFAAGVFVQPFGALFFGRLGDLIGRTARLNPKPRRLTLPGLLHVAYRRGAGRDATLPVI